MVEMLLPMVFALVGAVFKHPRSTSVLKNIGGRITASVLEEDRPSLIEATIQDGIVFKSDASSANVSSASPDRARAAKEKPFSHGTVAGRQKKSNGDDKIGAVYVTARFNTVFFSVLGLTIVSGAADVVLAFWWDHPTANQQATYEMFNFGWKAGLGAIFGLIGGKLS